MSMSASSRNSQRRFTLNTIFVFVAVVACGLVAFVSKTEFKVVALVRVRHRANTPISRNFDFRGKQKKVVETLLSEEVLKTAVTKTIGDASQIEAIRKRLDVRRVGYTEIVSVTLRGRLFRDSKSKFVTIVQELLNEGLQRGEDVETELTVVQIPTLDG